MPTLTFSAEGLDSGFISTNFERSKRISRGICLLSHDLTRSGVGTKLSDQHDISHEKYSPLIADDCSLQNVKIVHISIWQM